jgi:hypothetical protein
VNWYSNFNPFIPDRLGEALERFQEAGIRYQAEVSVSA